MVHKKSKLNLAEIAALMGVCISLLTGVWLSGQQTALSDRVVRLHVVGASNSVEDQAVKLRVRDAVLAAAEPWMQGVSEPEEARRLLEAHLSELAQAGAQAAGSAVTATLAENEWFPTRRYTDFSFPAGRYTALRLTVGAGEGRNWWCVVFPSLCTGCITQEDSELAGSFTQEQIRLITQEDTGYTIQFKAMELWNSLLERLS